jgi:dethiobiotin synthetase
VKASRFIVTGTDTDIGKTVFAAGLVAALNGYYWKPVQAGLEDESDSLTVSSLSGLSADHILPETYRLTTPCSPHRAAELDGIVIEPLRLEIPDCAGPLIIEGAGGVMVPITRNLLAADVFASWGMPVIIVARTELGTINHSLLSIEALRSRGIPITGIAFIGDENADTQATICALGKVKHLGRLPMLDPLNRDTLAAAFAANFTLGDFLP